MTTAQGSSMLVGAPLELWGGPECTVNRVRGRYFDQIHRTGHETRLDDLARFAELGLKALRYPVLWERTAPDRPELCDWRWSDARLEEIRRLGMTPIAGLVHHGSGPRYTNLLDPGFAGGLAQHARATAERYPWIDAYTPVNEPLTTARFSALYGHWYPHARGEGPFLTALLNQIEATVQSMRAIRAVNPAARLIQTEDLGHVFATDPLAHQAAFENERRWITFDLLCGRVTPEHPMWRFFEGNDLCDRVRALNDAPCPPDVMGLNYYLSSERLLDHRLELYPREHHGGNGRERYADVEAIRAVAPGVAGVGRLLQAAHARFGLPLAITEAHNGCTREEQLRWLRDIWSAALEAREAGVSVQAVTAWSLLGAVDWNSLLTRDEGHYEPGVFDVRSGKARPTALAALCRQLSGVDPAARTSPSPAAEGPGWWARDIRFGHAPVWAAQTLSSARAVRPPPPSSRPLLIAGATGTLGQAFARACDHRGLPYVLTDRREMAIDDRRAVGAALDRHEPWALINTAGYVRVDDAEDDASACLRANGEAVETLARACAARKTPLVTFSSDLVFDGRGRKTPYLETDAPGPLGVYGASKAMAERAVADHGGLIVRTSAFFAALDRHNFAHAVAHSLSLGRSFHAAGDQVVSPTYVPDLVDRTLDLLIDGETGVRHLTNVGAVSWAEFAQRLAVALGLDPELVEAVAGATLGQRAVRPAYAALGSVYGAVMPMLDHAIDRFAAAVRPTLNLAPAKPPAVRRTILNERRGVSARARAGEA